MQKATTLWIDTTGNANTPKRWSGSAWAVVTDKAATDAASAAAAAQATATAEQTAETQAQAKINSEATTRADADTALGQRIDTVNAAVGDNTAAISAEQTARADGDSANASAITSVSAGLAFKALTTWMFQQNNNGFTAENATIPVFSTVGPPSFGATAITANAADPRFLSPTGLSITGATNTVVRALVRLRTLVTWDGTLYWTTSAHGFSASYSSVAAQPSGAASDWVVVEWDLSGNSDWTSSVITSLRFDFDNANGSVIDVRWIMLGNRDDPNGASATQQLTAGTTIGGSAYAAATVMVDANGHIGGTRLASDGTTSSFAIVADQFQIVSPSGGARTEYSNGNWRVYDSAGTLRVALGVNI
jgi:hypothetical protein